MSLFWKRVLIALSAFVALVASMAPEGAASTGEVVANQSVILTSVSTPMVSDHPGGYGRHDYVISSQGGWQGFTRVPAGANVTVQILDGSWTADYRNNRYVGAEGYPDGEVWGGNDSCKEDPSENYGELLSRTAGMSGGSGSYVAGPGGGSISFMINDRLVCQGDNKGYLRVAVIVSQG